MTGMLKCSAVLLAAVFVQGVPSTALTIPEGLFLNGSEVLLDGGSDKPGKGKGGLIPVYVHPTLRIWRMHLDREPSAIVAAAERLADAHRLSLAQLPGQKSVYRLEKKKLNYKELEEYCQYPTRNLNNWKPITTFGQEFRRVVAANRRSMWDGRVRLDLHIPADRNLALVVVTSCYFYVHDGDRGALTTSRAVYELDPLKYLVASLESDALIAVEPLSDVKPDLAGMRDKKRTVQSRCGYTTGVYLNPESGEVSCTLPPGLDPVKKTSLHTAAGKGPGSSFSIQVEEVEESKQSPIRDERGEGVLTVDVLYDEMDSEVRPAVLPLNVKACGASLTSASVVAVNGKSVEEIPLLLGARKESAGCEEIRATLDLGSLAQSGKGSNRFVVQAGELTAEVVLESP